MDQQPPQELNLNGGSGGGETATAVTGEKNGYTNGDHGIKVKVHAPNSIPAESQPSNAQLPVKTFGDRDGGDDLDSLGCQPFRIRSDSISNNENGDQNESKVLVIYTGGTIGMIRNDENSKCNFHIRFRLVGPV